MTTVTMALTAFNWMNEAACAHKDPKIFDNDEDSILVPPEAKRICDHCPVKDNCLTANLSNPWGIYGGTTGEQRNKILRGHVGTPACPGCGSTEMIMEDVGHVCIDCGVSWPILEGM